MTESVLSYKIIKEINGCERTGLGTEISELSFMSCIFMPYLTLAAIQYKLVK